MSSTGRNTKLDFAISRAFSSSVMKSLAQNESPKIIREVSKHLVSEGLLKEKSTYRQFFKVAYKYLFKNYRSEYLYKNAIANNILLGRHSLNTSFMLQEFRAANCKVDAVVLNGTSNVYEVKSELDTFERLERQISAYQKVFDRVQVITSRSQSAKLLEKLDDKVGVYVLSEKGEFGNISIIRESVSGKSKVRPEVIFDSLRRTEYLEILKNEFSFIPDVPNTKVYKVSKEKFISLSPEKAHDLMVEVLKMRGSAKQLKEFINSAPKELKASLLNLNFNSKEIDNFWGVLEHQI